MITSKEVEDMKFVIDEFCQGSMGIALKDLQSALAKASKERNLSLVKILLKDIQIVQFMMEGKG